MREWGGGAVASALFLALCAVLLSACRFHPVRAPDVDPSPAPVPRSGEELRAGFGRADITPPPGPGLMGYGPEGKRSRGWRQRLYARALVLEDRTGERLALVTVDLGQLSPLLHREVAARLPVSDSLGPDRLILAATHTHAGPGHHFGYPSYDGFGSSVSGFDPAMVEFLARRIARAVHSAAGAMTEARARWGTVPVWGLTENRSADPFRQNDAAWKRQFRAPLQHPNAAGMVDSTLAVLRVDTRAGPTEPFRPAGAFSVFAMHPTGNPSANELFDGDIYGIAARVLELHIDSINGRDQEFRPDAVALLANGAEGDVIPDMPTGTRCQVPTLHRVRRPSGSRTPPGPELWIPPDPTAQAECITDAREETVRIGSALGRAMAEQFDSLENELVGDLPIRRVFHVARLVNTAQLPDLCHPQPGTATLAGGENGRTRYRNWHLLGMIDAGFAEDADVSARDTPEGCHGFKRPFLGRLQRTVSGKLLPQVAQLTVARVGDMLLATLPFEPTTVVGGMVRQAALDGAARAGHELERAVLIGLANGYNQYVATEPEYALQHYEGASTLYGPETAAHLSGVVEALAQRLPAPGRASPPARVPPLELIHTGEHELLPRPDAGPPPSEVDRSDLRAEPHGDTLVVVSWTDAYPGRLVPADGPVLKIEYTDTGGRVTVLWDDDPDLEVWALGPGEAGYRWEARWSPASRPASGEILLLGRPALPAQRISIP